MQNQQNDTGKYKRVYEVRRNDEIVDEDDCADDYRCDWKSNSLKRAITNVNLQHHLLHLNDSAYKP